GLDTMFGSQGPPVGQAWYNNDYALIRLGSQPALSLRLDGKGDATLLTVATIEGASLGYSETRAGIVRRIAQSRGSAPLVDPFFGPSDIDRLSFYRLNALQPGAVGFWFDGDISIAAAPEEIMAGCAGFWRIRLDGQLSVDQLDVATLADFVIDCPADLKAAP